MKILEKSTAKELRGKGFSLREISEKVGVSKSSVSVWTRNVVVPQPFRDRLFQRAKAAHEKGTRAIRASKIARWKEYRKQARDEFSLFSKSPDFMFGLALYIGEGDKRSNCTLSIVNCDPKVLRSFLFFLQKWMYVLRNDVRCSIQIPPELSTDGVRQFWARYLNVSIKCISEHIVRKISCNSRKKRGNKWPNGICRVEVYSTKLKQKMKVWMEKALQRTVSSSG